MRRTQWLAKTATGKIQRYKLREDLAAGE